MIILFTLNFFYKKYVINLKIDQKYKISAIQLYDFKSKSLNNVLDKVFTNINRKYLVQNKVIEKFNATLNQSKSQISFTLITRKSHDLSAKQIEEGLNNYYINSIKKIINDIENNLYLFDLNYLREEYKKEKEKNINKFYNNLVNSDFYKEYPPLECSESKRNCLKSYVSYYNFILQMLEVDSKNYQIVENLKLKNSLKKSNIEIFQDFYTNRNLFNIKDLIKENDNLFLFNKKDKFFAEVSEDELNFLKMKYSEFQKTNFYSEYIYGDNYCKNYYEGCFKDVSFYLNKTLYEHKREVQHKYKVEQIKENNNLNNYILKDAPIVLGLTTAITYIFFILTNKFFRRKLK